MLEQELAVTLRDLVFVLKIKAFEGYLELLVHASHEEPDKEGQELVKVNPLVLIRIYLPHDLVS